MNIQRESSDSLRVELSARELQTFHLSYELLNYEDKKTKEMLKTVLDGAGRITGFDSADGKLLIEVFPAPDKGCTVYFTHLGEKRKRYRQKLPGIYVFETSEAMMTAVESLSAAPAAPSELFELKGQYVLILHEPAGNALLEYGSAMPASRFNLAYIREHGRLLTAPHAVDTILKAVRN